MTVRHPKKEVNDALKFAAAKGWHVEVTSSGHKWGEMRCGKGVDAPSGRRPVARVTTPKILGGE